ncbi:MAG: hypothetical protein VB099_20005 [Candidatus Limiplasma sp.]|nr:hypothetical protein [Candidatus Limiplasma sp.]
MQIALDAEGRVIACSFDSPLKDAVEIEPPEGFDPERQNDWRMEEGALVYDPLPEAEPVPTPLEAMQTQLNDVILAMADVIGGALG